MYINGSIRSNWLGETEMTISFRGRGASMMHNRKTMGQDNGVKGYPVNEVAFVHQLFVPIIIYAEKISSLILPTVSSIVFSLIAGRYVPCISNPR